MSKVVKDKNDKNLLNTHLSVKVVIIAVESVVLLFSVLLNFRMLYQGTNSQFNQSLIEMFQKKFVKPPLSVSKCKFHDNPDQTSYLRTYTVKTGDSLLNVTEKLLGDKSRVEELINFNKQKYPNLSLEKPFIEVGWKLYYPPKDIPETSGRTSLIRGVLKNIGDNFWEVSYTDDTWSGDSHITYIKEAEFRGKRLTEYKIGDCVSIFMDIRNNWGYPRVITPQELNFPTI